MYARLGKILRDECALKPDDLLVLGVSGGPDSLCLLDLLVWAGFSPVVAHFDHRLRPDSAQDAEQVRVWADRLGLRFILGRQDVAAYAQANSLSLEEAARMTRYRFLFDGAEQVRAQAVAVAHNADDQVETVLMHLLRGSGLAGLRGMPVRALPNPWSDAIPLIRPLLGVWRSEILEYCAGRSLQPLMDPTNLDTTYFRNSLRHELFPYLETYNPEFRRVLWRTAELVQGDYQVLHGLVQQVWEACLRESDDGFVELRLEDVMGQPAAIQRHLIRRAAGMLRPDLRDIGYEAIERALDYLANLNRPPQIDWMAGLRLASEGGRFWIADWQTELPGGAWPRLLEGIELVLVPGEVVELENGWRLLAEPVTDLEQARRQAVTNPDPFQVWLGLDDERVRLVLHCRREGDRIQILGMPEGSIKVSELMINLKLPRRARSEWPLVYVDDQVAWIPGYRCSHDFRLSPATRRAVHLRFVHGGTTPLI